MSNTQESKPKKTSNGNSGSYTFEEDMAIIKYMTTDKRYLRASGIAVWKEAEKLGICSGRPYLSMKERYRKTIVKNLRQYNLDQALCRKISEFMRASKEGKKILREKQI